MSKCAKRQDICIPTYFEWLYLMAMLWFGRQGIEYGIIETGLGGRLDATNHIAQPVLTIITSISYDHMEILGQTLTEIAGEKAGILKSGVPVICDGSEPEAMAVIRKRAAILHCPLKVIEPEQVKILLIGAKTLIFYCRIGMIIRVTGFMCRQRRFIRP